MIDHLSSREALNRAREGADASSRERQIGWLAPSLVNRWDDNFERVTRRAFENRLEGRQVCRDCVQSRDVVHMLRPNSKRLDGKSPDSLAMQKFKT